MSDCGQANSVFEYDAYFKYQERALDIWGKPLTIYETQNRSIVGYEDELGHKEVTPTADVEGVSNSFKCDVVDGYINFNPNRSVYYKYNYFPDKGEELVTGFFRNSAEIVDLTYVRTSVVGNVSPWGDMIFKVVHVVDIGKFKTLKRMWFLRPISDSTLASILVPGTPIPTDLDFKELT